MNWCGKKWSPHPIPPPSQDHLLSKCFLCFFGFWKQSNGFIKISDSSLIMFITCLGIWTILCILALQNISSVKNSIQNSFKNIACWYIKHDIEINRLFKMIFSFSGQDMEMNVCRSVFARMILNHWSQVFRTSFVSYIKKKLPLVIIGLQFWDN